MWIFGYGSLIWKAGFDFEERRHGYIEGWDRRFWQESTDHRGVPEAPGRVVTLVPNQGSQTWGAAYRVHEETFHTVIEQLDFREKGGYERHVVAVHDGEDIVTEQAIIYIGAPGNPNWGGPLATDEIAAIVARAHGPSGSNLEYVLRLHESLLTIGVEDRHLNEIVSALGER